MQGGTELAFMSTTESIDVAVSSRIDSLNHTFFGGPAHVILSWDVLDIPPCILASFFILDHNYMALGCSN